MPSSFDEMIRDANRRKLLEQSGFQVPTGQAMPYPPGHAWHHVPRDYCQSCGVFPCSCQPAR